MLPMLKTAASEENRHVAIIVRGGVSKIRGEHDYRVIKEIGTFEFPQKISPTINRGLLNKRKLIEFLIAPSVVRQRVIGFIDPFERANCIVGCKMLGNSWEQGKDCADPAREKQPRSASVLRDSMLRMPDS